MIAGSVMTANDETYLREVLALDQRYFEHQFDFRSAWGNPKPTKAFLGAVEQLTQNKAARVNVGAQVRYKTEKRAELTPGNNKAGRRRGRHSQEGHPVLQKARLPGQ